MEAEPLSRKSSSPPWANLDLAVGEIAGVALAAENVVLQRGRKSTSWQMGQLHASYVGLFKKKCAYRGIPYSSLLESSSSHWLIIIFQTQSPSYSKSM